MDLFFDNFLKWVLAELEPVLGKSQHKIATLFYIINVLRTISLYVLNLFTLVFILNTCLFYVTHLILLEAQIFYS